AALVYILTIIGVYLIAGPVIDEGITNAGFASALFYSNFFFWSHDDYFQFVSALNPFVHTWSLSVEEQFYLVFPFLLLYLRRFAWALLGIGAISFLWSITVATQQEAFYLLPSRIWEFGIGAIIAIKPPDTKDQEARLATVFGLIFIALSLPLGHFSENLALNRVFPVIGTGLVLVGGLKPGFISEKFLGNFWLASIGQTSYAAYLIHWPLLVLFQLRLNRDLSHVERGVLIGVTFAAAFVTHHVFEKVSRTWIRSMKPLNALAVGGALTALVCAVMWGIQWRSESVRRLDQKIAAIEAGAGFKGEQVEFEKGSCFVAASSVEPAYNFDKCIPAKSNRPRVFLLGDSFAAHRIFGLKEYGSDRYDIYQASSPMCSPLSLVSPAGKCFNTFDFFIKKILIETKPTVVIVAARWNRDLELFGAKEFRNLLSKTLAKIKSTGVTVLLIGMSPIVVTSFPAEVTKIIRQEKSVPRRAFVSSNRNQELNSLIASVAKEAGVLFVDPTQSMCKNDECLAAIEGQLLYFDYGHMTPLGSEYAAKPVIDLINTYLDQRR
ncbi:MAG: acyltransferase family protein, partial [Bdellovibrionota bacterium]